MKFIKNISTPNPYLIPISIFAGLALIAAALFFSNHGGQPIAQYNNPTQAGSHGNSYPREEAPTGPQTALKSELDVDEYIYGNPDAEVFIIEYSDIDCPFCARVHPTLEQVVDESDGQIAWVFRHFPLEQLHPDAARKAAAAECVGSLAGNDAFWGYVDGLFKKATTDTYVDYGISTTDFEACINDETTHAAVEADLNRAVATGGRGTPHSIVATTETGVAVSGAQPLNVWVQTAETLLES